MAVMLLNNIGLSDLERPIVRCLEQYVFPPLAVLVARPQLARTADLPIPRHLLPLPLSTYFFPVPQPRPHMLSRYSASVFSLAEVLAM